MLPKRFLSAFLLSYFVVGHAFGQQSTDSLKSINNSFTATALYGLSSFSEKNTLTHGNFGGGEIAYRLNLVNNSSAWIKMLNANHIDFAFSYRNFQGLYLIGDQSSKGFAGNAYSMVTRLGLNLFQVKNFELILSPGLGFTYVTKTFYTNYNPLIGSHLNVAAELGLKTEMSVSSSTKLQLGFDFFHFSNSAFKLPNEGINTISASLGIIQNVDIEDKPKHTVAFNIDHKNSIELGAGIGHRGLIQVYAQKLSYADSLKQVNATSHLNNMGFYVGYNYRLNSLISLKAATDIVYYFVTYNYDNYLTTVQEYGTSKDKFSEGISLGGDIWLGKLAFEANYGYYLHLDYATTPIHFYYTFGTKYYFTSWAAVEAKIYLHETQAHYANFGLLFNIH